MNALELHHRRAPVSLAPHGSLLVSAGVRGAPGAAPGLRELLDGVAGLEGPVADLSASAGGGALAAGDAEVEVLEPSFAGLRAAAERFAGDGRVTVRAGLPWQLRPGGYRSVLLLPPADRGNERVRAELAAAARGLAPGGVAYVALHKDLGAKRYERDAAAWFASVEVVARSKGWRLARLQGPRPDVEALPAEGPWQRFEGLGRAWWARPGVFASRRVDAGSALLLEALAAAGGATLEGARVLDLGCGTGVLAHAALAAGAARVTAVDDDLAAVESARRNLAGRAAEVLHSDLDAALPAEARFDAVLVNPPFHLGKQVRLALGRAFLAAARALLDAGGEAWIVANRSLPYEAELASWRGFDEVRGDGVFKVLRARR